jgi:hypothetical protein
VKLRLLNVVTTYRCENVIAFGTFVFVKLTSNNNVKLKVEESNRRKLPPTYGCCELEDQRSSHNFLFSKMRFIA